MDNERCACAVVGRIEVDWMQQGGFCWPRPLIHEQLQFCSRFKHAKKSLGSVPSNKCAGWTSGNTVCTTGMSRGCIVIVRIFRAELEFPRPGSKRHASSIWLRTLSRTLMIKSGKILHCKTTMNQVA